MGFLQIGQLVRTLRDVAVGEEKAMDTRGLESLHREIVFNCPINGEPKLKNLSLQFIL